jgi:DNA polymerase-3 subunit gamma/tau
MYKIPETIISRCQCFQFERFSIEQIKSVVENVCSKENIKISPDALTKVAYLADGAARDALSILEQLSMLTNNDITLEDVEKVFGLVDIDNKIKFINNLVNKDIEKSLESFNNYVKAGSNLLILCNDIIEILIEELLFLQTNNLSVLKLLANHSDDIKINLKDLISLINV